RADLGKAGGAGTPVVVGAVVVHEGGVRYRPAPWACRTPSARGGPGRHVPPCPLLARPSSRRRAVSGGGRMNEAEDAESGLRGIYTIDAYRTFPGEPDHCRAARLWARHGMRPVPGSADAGELGV